MRLHVPMYTLLAVSMLCIILALANTFALDSARIGTIYFTVGVLGLAAGTLAAGIIGRVEKLERAVGERPRPAPAGDLTGRRPDA